jgi:hypothetical protein
MKQRVQDQVKVACLPRPHSLTGLITGLITGLLCLSATMSVAVAQPRAQAKAKPAASTPLKGAKPSSKLKARAELARKKAQAQAPQAGGGKVIEFKALSVEGTVQRPSAAYLLQRRKLKFRGLEPKKSFLPEVLKSVQRAPF